MFDDKKTTADEQKLVFETRHDEMRLTPTSKNRPVSSRRLVCGGHKDPNFKEPIPESAQLNSRHHTPYINTISTNFLQNLLKLSWSDSVYKQDKEITWVHQPCYVFFPLIWGGGGI